MKKLIFAVCAVMCTVGAWAQAPADLDGTTLVKVGMEAPAFVAKMIDGTEISSADLRGKIVLLNFWATWCPPCREELTRVQADIVERFAGKDFVFLPLSRSEDQRTVEKFMEKNGYSFLVGIDGESVIYDKFASKYIPRNFVIGKDGKVALASVGYTPEEFDEMVALIEKLLK